MYIHRYIRYIYLSTIYALVRAVKCYYIENANLLSNSCSITHAEKADINMYVENRHSAFTANLCQCDTFISIGVCV